MASRSQTAPKSPKAGLSGEKGAKTARSGKVIVDPAIADPHPTEPKPVSGWIKFLVLFHLVGITIWAIPNPPEGYTRAKDPLTWKLDTSNPAMLSQSINDGIRLLNMSELKNSPFRFYDLGTGFWQYWDMFAPNPADTDLYGEATVTYKNGTTALYEYPRMYKLGIIEKYTKERYRKFYERASDPGNQFLWPTFAQRVALLMFKDPSNPPVSVQLTKYTLVIQPPDKPQITKYTKTDYYKYAVNQQVLQQQAKGFFEGAVGL